MVRAVTDRERELHNIIEPYFVYQNGGYLKENAPEEVRAAHRELLAMAAEERENMLNNL